MNKLKKIIFFICIFSYILSTEVTNIESSNVILGEIATFNLTVQNYIGFLVHRFYLGDNAIKDQITLNCKEINDTFLTCDANLDINELEYLINLTKILYTIDKKDTGATVTINKPSTLKYYYLVLIIMNYIIQVFLLNSGIFQSQIVKKMKLIMT